MNQNRPSTTDQDLLTGIRDIWEASRTQAIRTVNSTHVCANWLLSKQTVEAEQVGEQRAEYGKKLCVILFGVFIASDKGQLYSLQPLPSGWREADHVFR